MATYREIKGLRVPYLDSDLPSASASTQEGQVWYNSSTGKLRAFIAADTWATTSPVNTGRNASVAGGTQTAGLVAMGTPFLNSTEEYNGSGWSSGGNINTAREEGGSGGSVHTQTAAIIFAGRTPPSTAVAIAETYDGSSWTEIADLNTARRSQLGGAGSTTACIAFGGNNPDPVGDQTESWNGTAWTEVADMNEPVSVGGGSAGTSSASALCAGGYGPPGLPQGRMATVEEWDNTSWTETADLNTARYILAGAGTTTAAVYFGGNSTSPAKVGVTESFDGTSWTETADLPAATQEHSGTGSLSAALMISGNGASPAGTVCAEFQKSILTFTPASWASGGNLNQVRGSNKGFGIQTAALTTGGAHENPGATPATQKTETYDGTSWTEVNDTNTGRQSFGSLGTTTAGFMVAGGDNEGTPTAVVESWDGTNWTETTDVNTARTSLNGSGTTTAALVMGGYNPPPTLQQDIVESWNGSAWTEVGDLNTRRSGLGNAQQSPSTDTIAFGGYTQPPPNTANAETWDGSSWTEVGNLNTAKDNMGGTGASSTAALCFGARTTTTQTEDWDGTVWSTAPTVNTGRGYMASAGASSQSALMAGGEYPYKANTEEFTGVTSAAEAADVDFD